MVFYTLPHLYTVAPGLRVILIQLQVRVVHQVAVVVAKLGFFFVQNYVGLIGQTRDQVAGVNEEMLKQDQIILEGNQRSNR